MTKSKLLVEIFRSLKRLRRRMATQRDLFDDTIYQIQHIQEIKRDLDELMERILDDVLPMLDDEQKYEVLDVRFPEQSDDLVEDQVSPIIPHLQSPRD